MVSCDLALISRELLHMVRRGRKSVCRTWTRRRYSSMPHNIYCGTPYAIKYWVCTDRSHNGKVSPIDGGYVGMPGPSAANWYYQGFLQIAINGRDIGTTPISSMLVAENDRRAIVNMVWHDEAANVRLRFLALPHDNLFTECIDPKREIKSVQLTLKCYPSGFPAADGRTGARRIQTPSLLLKPQPERSETLPAKDNWWCVYYDEIYDVANHEGDGPCGLLALPEEIKEFKLLVGSYLIQTDLTYPARARRIRLALWDFTGKTNACVLQRMPTRARRYARSWPRWISRRRRSRKSIWPRCGLNCGAQPLCRR